MAKAYEYHPLSKKFPRMAADVFKAFCADIRERGLDKPIELLDGMIFDGRHRYEACLQEGIEPRFTELRESTEAEPYVRAVNALRRHMSKQELAEWLVQDRNSHPPKGVGQKTHPPLSNNQIAKTAGIDRRAVDRADAIDKKAAPELKAAIAEGTVKRQDAAKIVNKSPAVQAKAIERVKRGEAKTVDSAVKGKRGVERRSKPEQFKAITELLSRMVKELDRLNKVCPGEKFFRASEGSLESFARALKEWKVAVR